MIGYISDSRETYLHFAFCSGHIMIIRPHSPLNFQVSISTFSRQLLSEVTKNPGRADSTVAWWFGGHVVTPQHSHHSTGIAKDTASRQRNGRSRMSIYLAVIRPMVLPAVR